MNEKRISEALTMFLPTLQVENWFENVGNFPADAAEIFAPFLVENISDAGKIKKSIMSNDWENLDLDVRNDLFAFAQNQMNYNNTDPVEEAIKAEFFKQKDYLTQKAKEKNLPDEVFDWVLLGIVMSAFMEFCFQREKPKMPIDVNRNLLKILNLGYLPCGWKRKNPSENKAYNPLTFIEDSYLQTRNKKSQHFDYQSGVLLVW